MSIIDAIQANRERARIILLSLGIILIGANLRAAITAIGPLLPVIRSSLGLTESQAGILNALPLLIFALISLIAPRVGEKFGVERVLAVALLAIAVGTVVRSVEPHFALWIGTILLSLGIALGNVLLPGLAKRELPSHAPMIVALYAAAMAASAGLSAGLAIPIATLPGSNWRWSLGCWAFFALIAFAMWLPQLCHAPHRVLLRGDSKPAALSPWKHFTGWSVSLFFALHSAVFYSIVSWYPSYAETRGISLGKAGMDLFVYQLIAVGSNLACAPLIKRSQNQVVLGALCGTLLLIGATGLALQLPFPTAWIALLGLGAGIAMTTSLSLFGLRTVSYEQASRLSGMAQFIGYTGAAAGPLLFGVLREKTDGWSGPLLMLCFASLGVIAFAALSGRDTKIL